MEITKGKCSPQLEGPINNQYQSCVYMNTTDADIDIAVTWASTEIVSFKQADIIAEGINIYKETGFTPSQLLEQRDELLAALEEMMARYPFGGSGTTEDRNRACEMARKAIKSTKS